jgi:nucleotide-binding universal stress UspA family protein
MLPLRTILCPTDFSKTSKHAFQMACTLAWDYAAHVIVLHVVEPPPFVSFGELEKALQLPEGYRRELEESLRRFQSPEPVSIEHCLYTGHPAKEILSLARERHCDAIVMGTHGRTGLGRLLLGSVAEEVVRKAPCPVLTVKIPVALTASTPDVTEPKAGVA